MRTMRRFQLCSSSPLMKVAGQKCQWRIEHMLGVGGPATREVEVEEEEHVIEMVAVIEPAEFSELDQQVIEAMRKVLKAI